MSRPDLQGGFLGGQPKFGEVGLELHSHEDAEFKVKGDNHVVIKMKTKNPIKTVTKLVDCSNSNKELEGHVLVQRKQGMVQYNLVFPHNGWYKFMVFALPESDSAESLPGVYNYLIEVSGNNKKAYPYAKVFTKFYTEYCFLDEPLYLKEGNSASLQNVKFEVKVPGAKKVAVHAGEEWFQLTEKGGEWEGKCNLQKYCGKKTKVTLNGCYDDGGSSYSVLLEYII